MEFIQRPNSTEIGYSSGYGKSRPETFEKVGVCSTIVTYSILICATKNAHAFLYVHSLLSAIDNH